MFAFRKLFRSTSAGLAWLSLVLGAGCGQGNHLVAVAEKGEKQYQYAEQMLREDKTDEALAAFLQVSKAREDDGPESHLEAGLILLNIKKDPVAAIYHFQKYLEAKPTSDQAPQVAQLINTAKKEFARTLPGNPNIYPNDVPVGAPPAKNLTGMALQSPPPIAVNVAPIPLDNTPSLSHPTTPIHEPVSTANPTPVAVTPVSTPAPTPKPAPIPSGRTYIVQKGDTLSSISRDKYRNQARYKDIFNANKDQLQSIDAPLHPGQVLKLPQ